MNMLNEIVMETYFVDTSFDSVLESSMNFDEMDAVCEEADASKKGAFQVMAQAVKNTIGKVVSFIRSIINKIRRFFTKLGAKRTDKKAAKILEAAKKKNIKAETARLRGIDSKVAEFILKDSKKDASEGITVSDLMNAANNQKAKFGKALSTLSSTDPSNKEAFSAAMKDLKAAKVDLDRILKVVSKVDKYVEEHTEPEDPPVTVEVMKDEDVEIVEDTPEEKQKARNDKDDVVDVDFREV